MVPDGSTKLLQEDAIGPHPDPSEYYPRTLFKKQFNIIPSFVLVPLMISFLQIYQQNYLYAFLMSLCVLFV